MVTPTILLVIDKGLWQSYLSENQMVCWKSLNGIRLQNVIHTLLPSRGKMYEEIFIYT